MKKIALHAVVLAAFVGVFVIAPHAYAQSAPTGGLVTCGQNGPLNANGTQACGFPQLVQLISNILDFLLFVVAPIIMVCVILYAGILLIFAGGSTENVSKAKGMFFKALIGMIIAMLAWTAVKFILIELGVNLNIFPAFWS